MCHESDPYVMTSSFQEVWWGSQLFGWVYRQIQGWSLKICTFTHVYKMRNNSTCSFWEINLPLECFLLKRFWFQFKKCHKVCFCCYQFFTQMCCMNTKQSGRVQTVEVCFSHRWVWSGFNETDSLQSVLNISAAGEQTESSFWLHFYYFVSCMQTLESCWRLLMNWAPLFLWQNLGWERLLWGAGVVFLF